MENTNVIKFVQGYLPFELYVLPRVLTRDMPGYCSLESLVHVCSIGKQG